MKHRYTKCHLAMIEVLIEAREATGMTVREAAPRLKRSKTFVSAVETGERLLNICEFIEYARLLGVDPVKLFKRVLALEEALDSLAPPAKKKARKNIGKPR